MNRFNERTILSWPVSIDVWFTTASLTKLSLVGTQRWRRRLRQYNDRRNYHFHILNLVALMESTEQQVNKFVHIWCWIDFVLKNPWRIFGGVDIKRVSSPLLQHSPHTCMHSNTHVEFMTSLDAIQVHRWMEINGFARQHRMEFEWGSVNGLK